MKPSIEQQVAEDIEARSRLGVKKYGFTVADNPLPLKAWLQQAYEESLDLPIYLKRAIVELETAENDMTRTMRIVADWLERSDQIQPEDQVGRNKDLAQELRLAMAAGKLNRR